MEKRLIEFIKESFLKNWEYFGLYVSSGTTLGSESAFHFTLGDQFGLHSHRGDQSNFKQNGEHIPHLFCLYFPSFCSLIHFSYHLSATIHMSMHHFPLLCSSIHISKSFIFVSIGPFSLGKALPGSGKRNSGPLVSVSLLGHSAKCSFFHIMSPPTQLSHHHCSSAYPFLPSLNIFAPPLL